MRATKAKEGDDGMEVEEDFSRKILKPVDRPISAFYILQNAKGIWTALGGWMVVLPILQRKGAAGDAVVWLVCFETPWSGRPPQKDGSFPSGRISFSRVRWYGSLR